MNNRERSGGKKKVGSPHFLASLALVFSGILFYVALTHLSDLINLVKGIYQIIWPFVMAFVVAWLLDPIVCFFEKQLFRWGKPKLRRGLSILLTYLLVILLLSALLYVVLPQVYESLLALIDRLPSYLEDLSAAVNELAKEFRMVDAEEAEQVVDAYTDIMNRLTGWVQTILPQLLNVGMSLGSGVINVLMALIASIYMLSSKQGIKAAAVRFVHATLSTPLDDRFLHITARANHIFSGFISGKLVDSLIIGLLCFIGTLLLRIPFAGLISLIVGVTNIIPFFGPFIGAIPCILILLIVDPWSALWFGIFIIALQQLDGNVIGPRILGDSTGVSALSVLVAISIGGSLAGVTGMILGVPLYAIGSELLHEYLELRLAKKAAKAAETDAIPAADTAPQSCTGDSDPANADSAGEKAEANADSRPTGDNDRSAGDDGRSTSNTAPDAASAPHDEKEM